MWPAASVWLCATEDLARDGSDFTNAEQQESEQVADRIAFGPFDVDMRCGRPYSSPPKPDGVMGSGPPGAREVLTGGPRHTRCHEPGRSVARPRIECG